MRFVLRVAVIAAAWLANSPGSYAQAPDPTYLQPTLDVQSTNQDIIDKANELGTPLRMFKFVHDQIRYEVYYGSKKGALGTLWSGKGNDFDQASLLIALLRAKGIPARYKLGQVRIDGDQLVHWSGIKQPWQAAGAFWLAYCNFSALGACKNPMNNNDPLRFAPFIPINPADPNVTVRLEHAWVELLWPAQYRGLDVSDAAPVWVPLDPSWKQRDFRVPLRVPIGDETTPGACAGKVCFDYDAFYAKFDPRLASEIWEDQIKKYVALTSPGRPVDDVIFDGPIIPYDGEVLPGRLPFRPETTPPPITTASLLTIGDGIPRHFRIGVGLKHPEVESDCGSYSPSDWPCSSTYIAAHEFYVVELVGKRLTLSFEPTHDPHNDDAWKTFVRSGGYQAGTVGGDGGNLTILDHCVRDFGLHQSYPSEYGIHDYCELTPVLKLEGEVVPFLMTSAPGVLPHVTRYLGDDRYELEIRRDFMPGYSPRDLQRAPQVETTYKLNAGEYVAVGVDARHTSDVEIQRRIDALVARRDSLKFAQEPVGVDLNGNGAEGELLLDQGDPGIQAVCDYANWQYALTHCDIAPAVKLDVADDLVGELLHLAALRYFQRDREERDRVFALDGFVEIFTPKVGIAKAGFSFTYLFNQPVGVEPANPVIDIRGSVTYLSPVDIAAPATNMRRELRLVMHAASVLENQVWEELIGSPFVSTVKGFQLVRERFPSQPLLTFAAPTDFPGPVLTSFSFNPLSAVALAGIAKETEAVSGCLPGESCVAYVMTPVAAVSSTSPPLEVYYSEHVHLDSTSGFLNSGIFKMLIASGDETMGGAQGFAPILSSFGPAPLDPIFNYENSTFSVFDQFNRQWGLQGIQNVAPSASASFVSDFTVFDPVAILSGNLHHSETDFSAPTDGPPFELVRTYNSRIEEAGSLGYGWTHNYEMRIEPTHETQEFVYLMSRATGLNNNFGAGDGARSDTLETYNFGSDQRERLQWDQLPYTFRSKAAVESVTLEIAYIGVFRVESPFVPNQGVPLESPPQSLASPDVSLSSIELQGYSIDNPLDIDLANFDSSDRLYYARLRIRYKGPAVRSVALANADFGNDSWPPNPVSLGALKDQDPSTCTLPVGVNGDAAKIFFDPVSAENMENMFGYEVQIAVDPVSKYGVPQAQTMLWRGAPGTGEVFATGPVPDQSPKAARERFITLNPTLYAEGTPQRPVLTFVAGKTLNIKLCQVKYSILTMPEELDFVTEDGSRERFRRSGSTWVPGSGVRDVLVSDGGGYRLTRPNGMQLHFQQPGVDGARHLTKIADPQGRSLLLSYYHDGNDDGKLWHVTDDSSVTGPDFGSLTPELTFTYPSGQVVVKDWTEREWHYFRDAAGNLVEVRDPVQVNANRTGTTYKYELADDPNSAHLENLAHNLTMMSFPKGATSNHGGDHWVKFEYYNSDRVASHTDSDFKRSTFLYNVQRLENQSTDARGFTTVYRHDLDGNLLQRLDPDGAVWSWEYDDDRNMIAETDPLGRVRRFGGFDALGNPAWVEDPGIRQFGGFDALGKPTWTGNPDVRTTTLEYDPVSGAPKKVIDKRGNERLVAFTADGLPGVTSATVNGVPNTTFSGSLFDPASRALCARYEPLGDGTGRYAVTSVAYFAGNRDVQQVAVRDATGAPTNCTPASGTLLTTTSFEYDKLGRRTSETTNRVTSALNATPIPVTKRYDYDDRDHLVNLTQPDGSIVHSTYDENGNLEEEHLEALQPNGETALLNRTEYHYDVLDRVFEVIDAANNPTTYAYDAGGNRISVTDPEGHTSHVEYDAMNRPIRAIDANGAVTVTEYDLLGRVIATTDPTGVRTTRTYDEVGELVALKVGDLHEAVRRRCYQGTSGCQSSVAAHGYHEEIVDPNLNVIVYEFDELGHPIRETAGATPDLADTHLSYDLRGGLTRVDDPKGGVTTFKRDALGREIEVQRPYAGAVLKTQYDETGNPIRITKPDNCRLLLTYDVMGRLVRRNTGTGGLATCRTTERFIDDQYAYDARGQLVAAKNAYSGLLRDYDALGRLTRETDTRFGGGVAYQYDRESRLTAKVYPDGKVLHVAYDASGRPVGITDPTGDTTRYVYDPAGRRVQTRSTASNLRTQLAYDPVGRLASIASWRADNTQRPLQSYPEYDDAGNRKKMDNALGETTYAYDALHRLVTAAPPNQNAVHYEYDGAGNRLHTGAKNGAAWAAPYQSYLYAAPGAPVTHQLLGIHDAADTPLETFAYDANGNVISWTSGATPRTLSWDTLDRLVTIDSSSRYVYDPLGRRIEKIEGTSDIRYQYDGLDVMAEYAVLPDTTTGAIVATYVFGPGIDEPLKIRRGATLAAYHSDGLGSILAVTSISEGAASSELVTYQYDAFGVIEASPGSVDNTYTYTGRERDGSGLYYYRARYYMASAGRFLSPDPIGLKGGINPYAYVGSNPINFTDPFGLISTSQKGNTSFAAPPGSLSYASGAPNVRGQPLSSGPAEWLYPKDHSPDIDSYYTVVMNGLGVSRDEFQAKVDRIKVAAGFYHPTLGKPLDAVEFAALKFNGYLDPYAKQLSADLHRMDHPTTIIAHSGGVIIAVNAAANFGLPQGTRLDLRSPVVSYPIAQIAAWQTGAHLVGYEIPYGDISGLLAPSLDPRKVLLAPIDIFRGFVVHTSTDP